MGQGSSSSVHDVTPEELSRKLADKFASQCFTGVELYSFKDNFRSLAEPSHTSDTDGGFLYWSEDTLIRFLSLPASLDVGSIIFKSVSYIGAFPFPSLAPAILDFESLVKVVAIVTGRYKSVIKKQHDPIKILFRSFAIYDRRLPPAPEKGTPSTAEKESDRQPSSGLFSIDDEDEEEDDDELSLAALDALDAIEVFHHAERPNINRARIPLDDMRKLIALLLVVAPLEENEPIAVFVERFSGDGLKGLLATADNIMRSFGGDVQEGITYRRFRNIIQRSMPFIFSGLSAMMGHFLFSKRVDMSTAGKADDGREPLLAHTGNILNLDVLSQISFFVKGDKLWRRLRPLYQGSEAGFSMGSFETKVMKWNAPTLILVSGQRITEHPETSREKAFSDTLPPRHYPTGSEGDRVTFGAFLQTPWKLSHKDCFGDQNTVLFQLEPVHEVFSASVASREYAYFNKDDGIGFGSPVQKLKQHHRPSPYLNLGPVSLTMDPSLDFCVFQHVGSGGAFHSSDTRNYDWQERFEIEEIEVWGCGGESEAEAQRKAWAWEEREALLRRQINLGKDIEADRALLEMAGLVGQNRSGGSV